MDELGMRSPEGVISGSFKFKPEIDAAIDEFRDLNVIIRAPEVGWLYVPARGLIVATSDEQFLPLPNEQHMMAGEVEAAFLDQLDQSDFVYVMNSEGYIGDMSIFEIGYSRGMRKPIYASNPLNFHALGIHDPKMIDLLKTSVPVMSPAEVSRDMHRRLANCETATPQAETSSAVNRPFSSASAYDLLLPPPVGHIAEGAILRFGKKVLLVADGRWQGERLTIPGTRVRPGERRAGALQRLMEAKMGADVGAVAHFATSFMIPKSGYSKSVDPDTFVFDDHLVDVRSEHLQPMPGIVPMWVSSTEVEALITSCQIEPNAATLLANYLKTAA
jgi:hypothetical protein